MYVNVEIEAYAHTCKYVCIYASIYMCAHMPVCAYGESVTSLTTGWTWGMELHQHHLSQSAEFSWIPLRGGS